MDVQFTVRPASTTPIYLQITYQLAHLITSGRLGEGHRLPTVRAVADRLGVNPGTVAQAYRELRQQGLLEAAPGRGTFVAPTPPVDADAAFRRALLDEALRAAIHRARGLGCDDDDIRQQLDLALGSVDGRPVVFAAPTLDIGRKYATSLERRVGHGAAAHPVTLGAIDASAPHAVALLSMAYFVLTFAGHVRTVEAALARLGRTNRVVGCATIVQPSTVEALRRLPPTARLCLATQEPYVPPTLDLIVAETGRPADAVAVVLDTDTAGARTTFERADVVIYTFGARDLVVTAGVQVEKRVEIVYDLTDDAVARVRRLLVPGA